MSRNRVFITVLTIGVTILVIMALFPGSGLASAAVTLVSILGGAAIFYQLHKESTIAKGQFLQNLDQAFSNSGGQVWHIATKLFTVKDDLDAHGRFLHEPITEDERVNLMAYLTFFETLYLLLNQRVLTMPEVDQLFRRRFFKATMSKDVQEIELVRNYYGYTNIYLLDRDWRRYLEKIDQLHVIAPHGTALEDAHNAYWGSRSDSPLLTRCSTYSDVIRLGGDE